LALLALCASASATPAQEAPAEANATDLLIARGMCLNCHAAEGANAVPQLAAPNLDQIGTRATQGWLESWLQDPQAQRPGSRMPNMMASLPPEARPGIAAEMASFLLSRSEGLPAETVEVHPQLLATGEALFQEIGCFACHQDGLRDRFLARMTTVTALREQLLDPRAARPSGLMPDMHLSDEEATAIAAWLLRDQASAGSGELQSLPGLRWQAYAWDGAAATGPLWEEATLFASGVATELHADYGGREDRYGLLFLGELVVPTSGNYTIYIGSDDGNLLQLDGATVLEAKFAQSHTRREVELELSAGRHELRLEYYEITGGQSLEAGWSGPGFEERPFAAEDFVHLGEILQPLGNPAGSGAGNTEYGRQLYSKLHCAQCHEPGLPGARRLPTWAELRPEQGCLASSPEPLVPAYTFTVEERALLNAAVGHPQVLTRVRSTGESLATTMAARACTSCHQRQGVGGPSAETTRLFQGSADLGDEGRVPPALDGVEAKLQPAWLRLVLTNGAKVRPYMKTRMPAFGETVGEALLAQFRAAAPPEIRRPEPPFDAAKIQMGRELAGITGFACIACHNLAGHASPGIPGLDLATARERLRPEWFTQWLRDPHSLRTTTRMPLFWDADGRSAITRLGEGRAEEQIPALWAYLSLGASMPLPQGLIADRDSYLLTPIERPLYFGTFMRGLSARVLTVGFPERVSLAFDEHHVRLAKVWRGDFMNAEGTWNGRAGQLEDPAGVDVFELPPGSAFAFLEEGQEWPTADGKEAGWRMRGHRRDAAGHPTFRYHFGELEVEESLEPVLAADGAFLRRRFVLRAPTEPAPLRFRSRQADGSMRMQTVVFQQQDGNFVAHLEEEISW